MPENREIDRIFEDYVRKTPAADKDRGRMDKGKPRVEKKTGPDHNRTVDLHGMTLDRAISAVEREIRDSRVRRADSVRIVTGKGRNSPGLHSPLVLGVEEYLERESGRGGFSFVKKDGFFLVCFKK